MGLKILKSGRGKKLPSPSFWPLSVLVVLFAPHSPPPLRLRPRPRLLRSPTYVKRILAHRFFFKGQRPRKSDWLTFSFFSPLIWYIEVNSREKMQPRFLSGDGNRLFSSSFSTFSYLRDFWVIDRSHRDKKSFGSDRRKSLDWEKLMTRIKI